MDFRLLRNLEIPLLVAVVVLACAGCLMVSSASAHDPRFASLTGRQIGWVCVGVLVMVGVMCVDYRRLSRLSPWIYGVTVALLALVLVRGHVIGGSQRWLDLGPLRLQPSELAKVLLVLTLATLLHHDQGGQPRLRTIGAALLHLAVPVGLILWQPDLGTALVIVALFMGMLWVWGASVQQLVALLAVGCLLVSLAWRTGIIRDYQKSRLTAFVNPDRDPSGAGYQLIQSQIAIGAGGLWGAGLYQGTQNRLAFIPTQTTDFIFTIAGEEFGFVGCVTLLLLYLLVLWRGAVIALRSESPLGTLVAAGVISYLAFQIFINLGMTMRLTPVSGMPLPFISYGGSSMLTSFAAIGLLQSVSMRRQVIRF